MSRTNAVLLIALAAAWGASFLFIRVAAPVLGPIPLAELRVATGAIALVVAGGTAALRTFRGRIPAFLVLGLLNNVAPFCLIASAELVLPASIAAILNATTPLATAVAGAFLLAQPLTFRRVAGLGVGLAGVVILVGWSPLPGGVPTILAVGASLGGATAYALAALYAARAMKGLPPMHVATGQLLASSALALPAALVTLPRGPVSIEALAAVVALGLLCTAAAYPIYFRLIAEAGALAASSVTFLVPVTGVLWGVLLLSEQFTLATAVGMATVLGGLVLVVRPAAPVRAPLRAPATVLDPAD